MTAIKTLIRSLKNTGYILDPNSSKIAKILTAILSENTGGTTRGIEGPRHVPTLMYRMPDGAINDNLDNQITKNGAAAGAVWSKNGIYDKATLTGLGDATSYFQIGRQWSLNQYRVHLKVQVNAVGAAPIIGIKGIWPGGPYSNFNNPQPSGTVNLLTGAITAAHNMTASAYNGVANAAVAGDVVDFTMEVDYLNKVEFRYRRNNVNLSDISIATGLRTNAEAEQFVGHSLFGFVLADGAYTVLDARIEYLGPQSPLFALDGDSISSCVRILRQDSHIGQLEQKIGSQVALLGAGSKQLQGMLATVHQILTLRPKYVIIFNWLNPCYNDEANPVNGGYATFVANFAKYISLLKQHGIKPIITIPQNWAVLDNSGAKCANFKAFLDANYPNELRISIATSEMFYDSTNFHLRVPSTGLMMDRAIQIAQNNGDL